jgi:hypothetical protein
VFYNILLKEQAIANIQGSMKDFTTIWVISAGGSDETAGNASRDPRHWKRVT